MKFSEFYKLIESAPAVPDSGRSPNLMELLHALLLVLVRTLRALFHGLPVLLGERGQVFRVNDHHIRKAPRIIFGDKMNILVVVIAYKFRK